MPKQAIRQNRDQATVTNTVIMKELLVQSLTNISVFAHRARHLTMTDQKIDQFVVETLAASLRKERMTVDETLDVLIASEKITNRARQLYLWSCEAFSKPTEKINIPPILVDGFDSAGLLAYCAEARSRGDQREYHDIHYWRAITVSKLSVLAQMAQKAVPEKEIFDIFGFFHKILSSLADGLSVFELVALVQLIEKEQFNFINAQIAGNTLVEAPSPLAAVRRSEILVIREPEPDGSFRTGLAG